MQFNPLNHPILNRLPDAVDISKPAWVEHIPTAFLFMEILKPRIFVELGVHSGNSYNAFCQAAKAFHLPTQCFGVDYWKGDSHAGFYDEEIYEKLSAYQTAQYGEFSKLIRKYFDDAIGDFVDGSIDLLHIDGCHTYEAVKHDFQAWAPKLSDRAVVLFHDTTVFHKDFGVWKFWEEIKSNYPSFNFVHGHGLGCVAVGKNVSEVLLQLFQDLNNDNQAFFHSLGNRIYEKYIGEAIAKQLENLRHQIVQEDRNSFPAHLQQIELKDTRIDILNKQVIETNDRYAVLLQEYKQTQDDALTFRYELQSKERELKLKEDELSEKEKIILAENHKQIELGEEQERLLSQLKQLQFQVDDLEVRNKLIEVSINQLEALNQEKEQIINEHTRELHLAQLDGNNKSESIRDLRQSLSFKIGWIFTAPLRVVYNSFNSWNKSKLAFFVHAGGYAFMHPTSLAKNLNKRNLVILSKALRYESPSQVLSNYKALINRSDSSASTLSSSPATVARIQSHNYRGQVKHMTRTLDILLNKNGHTANEIVSVIIPTKNAGNDFGSLLSSIRSQRGFKGIEIIVVDSGSNDNTLGISRKHNAKVVTIDPADFTHCYARNLGAYNATGTYLFFTVQDALLPNSSFLYELYNKLISNNVIAASCAESPRLSSDIFYRALSANHYKFLEVNGDKISGQPALKDNVSLRKCGQLSDIAMLMRREAFLQYEYTWYYGEDLDLGLRLMEDGYKLLFTSDLRIIHSHNRPAYYFLRRAFVDNTFLTKRFTDISHPNLEMANFLHDIIFSYVSLVEFIQDTIRNLELPTTVHNLDISDRIRQLTKNSYSGYETLPTTNLVDADFEGFVRKIHRVANGYPLNGKLQKHILFGLVPFSELLFNHLSHPYSLIDKEIVNDFFESLFKAFALVIGSNCYILYLSNNDNSHAIEIKEQLSRNI